MRPQHPHQPARDQDGGNCEMVLCCNHLGTHAQALRLPCEGT